MLTMQQYTHPDAEYAARGLGETICVFRFRYAAKLALLFRFRGLLFRCFEPRRNTRNI
jgi:hypothetical protein